MAQQKKSIQNTYLFCQEFAKSVNQRAKEAAEKQEQIKIDREELQPLTDAFNEVIDFVKCFLITAHDTLYGTLFMSMNQEINYNLRGLTDFDTDGTVFTMKFNPLFVGKYKLSNFISMVVGEILRLIFEHPSSFARINSEKDSETHNLLEDGSSASIYSMLQNDIKLSKESNGSKGLMIPDDFYSTADVMAETDMRPKDRESIEYYYKFLKEFRKRKTGNSSSSGQPGSGDGQSSDNLASPDNNDGAPTHNWEGKDADKLSEQGKELIHTAYENMSSDARGTIPSSILSQIQKLLAKPELTWKHILRQFIGSVPFPFRKSKKRLNRRQPERGDLCGRLPKRKVNIVICIDTSGSMSDDDIAYCMNEVFHIAKANETKITVIECDAQVNRVYVAKKPSDIQPDVKGRGGTCFTPAIEYINSEGKFKDALMIYFTDGYGESSVPKPMTYRNMWVVLQDASCLSVKEPYGTVKSLKMDGDYAKYKQSRR